MNLCSTCAPPSNEPRWWRAAVGNALYRCSAMKLSLGGIIFLTRPAMVGDACDQISAASGVSREPPEREAGSGPRCRAGRRRARFAARTRANRHAALPKQIA